MAKAGKYAGIIGTLQKIFGTDGPYQDKVDAVKAELRNLKPWDAASLAREYFALRAEKDTINEQLSDVNLRLEAVTQLMSDRFDADGLSQLKVDGQPIYYSLQPYPTVKDEEAFRVWCMANPDLVPKMQLWPATMASLAKQMLANGEALPPGVDVFAKPTFKRGSEE